MRRKALFLINAAAGTGMIRSKLYTILSRLTRLNFEVAVYPLSPAHGVTADRILEDCSKDYEILLCSGGDGTLNHVVNWVVTHGEKRPIAYFPSGSTNDFAHSLGISENAAEFCLTAAHGRIFPCDIGCFNGRYFDYVAAFGAFTKVSYSTDQNVKNTIGYLAYLLQGTVTLPENLSFRCHMVIEYDGQREEGDYIFGAVTNTMYIGGMKPQILKDAKLDDGFLDVLLVPASDDIRDLPGVLGALTSGSTEGSGIRVLRAKHVRFQAERAVEWTLDGEFGGTFQEASVDVLPGAVQYLVPRAGVK